jgi:ribosomal protein S18 acetylase RimI-like enzyme
MTSELVIRPAIPTDAQTITALTVAAYSKYIPLLNRQPQPMTADYAKMIEADSAWMIELEGQAVGSLVLVHEPEVMLIYSIAVSPEHQQQRIGTRLLAWAEQQAREAGYSRIRLYTNEHMRDNVVWYKRSGYEETGREPYLGSDLVHMAKRLEPLG